MLPEERLQLIWKSFKHNIAGWFIVIAIMGAWWIPVIGMWDQVIKIRIVYTVIYFVIGCIITRLSVPPLRDGLRPLEYFLGGIGWPLVLFLAYPVIVIGEMFDEETKKLGLKWYQIAAVTLFNNSETIMQKLADHWDWEIEDEEEST